MNKGLINYYRAKNLTIRNEIFTLLIIVFFIFIVLVAYTWGRMQGWDRGEAFAKANIEAALISAIHDGRNFYIAGMNIKFYPRKDGGVTIEKIYNR